MRLDVFLGILLQFPSARYGLVELRLSNEETDEQRIYKVRPEGYFDGFERDFAHLIMCFRYHFDGFDGAFDGPFSESSWFRSTLFGSGV